MTNLDKQIQLALCNDDMMNYLQLQEKYEWIVQNTNSINFKTVSITKNAFHTRNPYVRLSKIMHEWLDVGDQKERINNGSAIDALCPYYDLEREDQDHMF